MLIYNKNWNFHPVYISMVFYVFPTCVLTFSTPCILYYSLFICIYYFPFKNYCPFYFSVRLFAHRSMRFLVCMDSSGNLYHVSSTIFRMLGVYNYLNLFYFCSYFYTLDREYAWAQTILNTFLIDFYSKFKAPWWSNKQVWNCLYTKLINDTQYPYV